MRENRNTIAVIICAAGSSSRFHQHPENNQAPKEAAIPPRKGRVKKEYMPLEGRSSGGDTSPQGEALTVLGSALGAFTACRQIGPIVIAIPPGPEAEIDARASLPPELCSGGQDRILFVPGGSTRRASVHNALVRLESYQPSHVLIHDGARPWIKKELVERIIEAAIRYGAVIPALPLNETPKEISGSAETGIFVKRHLKRAAIYSAQTPQGFRFSELLRASEKAAEREMKEHMEYTDDAEVWGEFIGQVAIISGDHENRKITYPEDLLNPLWKEQQGEKSQCKE